MHTSGHTRFAAWSYYQLNLISCCSEACYVVLQMTPQDVNHAHARCGHGKRCGTSMTAEGADAGLQQRTLKVMPASDQARSPNRPSAGRQNRDRPSLRLMSVYKALAIVASGVLPLRCTRPRCSAMRVISPARHGTTITKRTQWCRPHQRYPLGCPLNAMYCRRRSVGGHEYMHVVISTLAVTSGQQPHLLRQHRGSGGLEDAAGTGQRLVGRRARPHARKLPKLVAHGDAGLLPQAGLQTRHAGLGSGSPQGLGSAPHAASLSGVRMAWCRAKPSSATSLTSGLRTRRLLTAKTCLLFDSNSTTPCSLEGVLICRIMTKAVSGW